jgi:hypothetical protein
MLKVKADVKNDITLTRLHIIVLAHALFFVKQNHGAIFME